MKPMGAVTGRRIMSTISKTFAEIVGVSKTKTRKATSDLCTFMGIPRHSRSEIPTIISNFIKLYSARFLFVAQNKLKSLTMASQPRLQVLAASKNRISTLKGFPYLPVLEHLRVEENPILKMPHLEAASILLVWPTLKKI
ncbi:hypothetical protein P8452_51681 [Trifolium repens]|nr:hypothetical protein P8452_51681 [Trifolium repens]